MTKVIVTTKKGKSEEAQRDLPAQRDQVSQGPSHSAPERIEALEALILSQNAIIERILELVAINA